MQEVQHYLQNNVDFSLSMLPDTRFEHPNNVTGIFNNALGYGPYNLPSTAIQELNLQNIQAGDMTSGPAISK